MGSVGKDIEKIGRQGQDIYKRIDPAFGYVTGDMTGTKEKAPDIGASFQGFLSEEQAGQLADRYTDKAARDKLASERSTETNTLIAKSMDQANGISALENSALRQNMLASINAQNNTAMRALRGSQAASGVRGGVAQAQMAEQRGQAINDLAVAERGLVGDNIKYKQEGLKTAATIVGNQEGAERDMAADKLSAVLSLRSQDMQLQGAEMQARAAAAAGGKKGGKGGGK